MSDPRFTDQLPDELPGDPMHWADAWIKEAFAGELQRNPNSMSLVTQSEDGRLSARVVLCKEFVPDPGYLVFYTNYKSRKVQDIAANPRVAVVFHWDAVGRQIRIEGLAVRSPELESDEYFQTRDWGSQLGAWGSDQSAPIESRDALVTQIRARAADLGIELGETTSTLATDTSPEIARPPHWGGIRVWPDTIELWREGPDRVHDRAMWQRDLVRSSESDFSVTPWVGTRLQP